MEAVRRNTAAGGHFPSIKKSYFMYLAQNIGENTGKCRFDSVKYNKFIYIQRISVDSASLII